jgi:hypothetical protein
MSDKPVRMCRRGAFADARMQWSWLDRELADCDFKDERLEKRFRSLLKRLGAKPGESLALACQDWANTKGAYRFLGNDRVTEAEILAGHFKATRERVAQTDGPILARELRRFSGEGRGKESSRFARFQCRIVTPRHGGRLLRHWRCPRAIPD